MPAEPRILILDDAPAAVGAMERGLRRAGLTFSLRRTEGREDFLAALTEFVPDIILAEIALPGLSAREVLRWLREKNLTTPLIVLAGTFTVAEAMAFVRDGAVDCLLKGDLESLPAALQRALKKNANTISGGEPGGMIAGNSGDLMALLDAEDNFIHANPAYERVLGHPPGELAGAQYELLIHPEDAARFHRLLDEAKLFRQQRAAELRHRHSDGRWRLFETAASSGFEGPGRPSRVILVSRDITERTRLELEMQHLAEFPRLNPNPVLAFAADGTLTYCNDAAMEMAHALKKKHPRELLPLSTPSIVKMCLAGGQSHLRQETSVSGRTISWSFYPILSSQVVHCYAGDITNRLNLESQLLQAQKMESVGQLAAGVAHDFNNILTIIQGHASMVLGMDGVSGPAVQSLKQISVASERAANLTRQLLMFSRKQLAQPRLIDLNETLRNVAKMLRVLIGESISLQVNLAPKIPVIHADPGMLEQVVMNLAVNARDAMPQGGTLTISTFATELDEAYVQRHPEAREGHHVCLSLSDTGCGMDATLLQHIFEPFFTTKEVGKGTGLGLATVYGIVHQHHGWLEVASEVGRGTTFKIFLPISSKSLQHTAGGGGPAHVPGGTETILVVEDELALRELVVEILQSYGYQILVAASGARALVVWREKKDEIDLVLTDMMMPEGVSGGELAARILAENAHMKIIYTSGYSVEALSRDITFQEGVNYLQKPYLPHVLAQTVRACLDR